MKKLIILGSVAVMSILTGCDDLLNDNRYPQTSIVNNPGYWSNEANCQLQVDRFIDEFNSGYGSGGSYGTFYFSTLNDDQVGSSFANWTYPQSVPATNGSWTFTNIRGANYIISGVKSARASLGAAKADNFEGIARFIRAFSYYKLVRNFGDVTWESNVVDLNDEEALYGSRTPRDIVMDSVFADLNFALENITAQSGRFTWSKDFVKAFMCEAALYEGTFCKYRTQNENGYAANPERANTFLNLAADYALQLLQSSNYGFTDDYQSIYNSTQSGGASTVIEGATITAFSDCPEIIFGRNYNNVDSRHSTISYTCSSTTTSGMSLDGFKAFLFLDGKPAATTSYDNTLIGVPTTFEGSDALSIENLLEVRDKRLSIITDPYVYYTGMTWSRQGASGMNSSSGFGVAKYDNVLLPLNARNSTTTNYTCAPIYWLSYIALNYAEAKAELGTLNDADLNMSLNILYKRAGLPEQTVAGLNAINDPANNMGVSSLLWEVRRCRRCELMFDENFRFWDLVRWHQLDKLDSTVYPDVLRGAYVANSPVTPPAANMDAEGFYVNYNNQRVFNYRYYLLPIPSGQLDLNPQLGQNPGW